MENAFTQVWDKVRNYWVQRTISQQVLIAGLTVAVIVTFIFMIIWLNKPDYKVLYTNLHQDDASSVVSMLQSNKTDYKLVDGGKTIMVPADQVYDLRLKVAGEGKIHGGGVGYEIFDDLKIGQTDFVQHVNYVRALQGELARTISGFPQVSETRVHLVIPHKSLFIEEQAPPTASIILKMKGSQKLTNKEIQGVVNLVAMSVENLKPDNITITDMKGQPLYTPEDKSTGVGLSSKQLDYKAAMERKIQRRIQELLGPVVGPGKIIARVNADLDFSHKTIRNEVFDPNGAVIRSETRNEESTKGAASLKGGEPDANFRGDGFTGTRTTQDSSRETRTTNYEINKTEEKIITATGQLKRLSVAVIVDGTYNTDKETGKSTYVPRTAEEMNRIKELVTKAVGFDTKRGDAIEVSNISFGVPEGVDGQTLFNTMLDYAQRLGKPFLNGILIFLFLILVVRPVIMALIRPRVAEQDVEEMAGLPSAERLALEEEEIDEEALDTTRRLENAKVNAMQLSEDNLEQAVRLLKTWLAQEA